MRILFVLPDPSYLQIYGSTVRELDARDHVVLLAYDRPEKGGRDVLPAGVSDRARYVGQVPWTVNRWTSFAQHLRLGVDYARYLDPRLLDVPSLRARMERYLPDRLRLLKRITRVPAWTARLLPKLSRLIERAIPSDPEVERFIRAARPDAVFLSPLVLRGQTGAHQTDVVKSAKALGVPVGLGVGSWDHLTTKGLIRIEPDRVFVWNEIQRSEAVELHGMSPGKVRSTGAQRFDVWFARRPSLDRAQFVAEAGLHPGRPYVLYLGSSRGIVDPDVEIPFVKRWVEALRHSGDPRLSELSVLVRPHPQTVGAWTAASVGEGPTLRVWPRTRVVMPMGEESQATFFHSMLYAEAVMGVNTSAMIEAAILGRPVFTLETGEFRATQGGTIHYRYLLPENGGFVRVAHRLDQHVAQLTDVLDRRTTVYEELTGFVERFVRPCGLDHPATAVLADEVERLQTISPTRVEFPPVWLRPLSAALGTIANRLHSADASRLARRQQKVRSPEAEPVSGPRSSDAVPRTGAAVR